MQTEKLSNNRETAPAGAEEWGKNVPPFAGARNVDYLRAVDGAEEYYYDTDAGVECRNLTSIDISTSEGQYEYMAELISNDILKAEAKLGRNLDSMERQRAEAELAEAKRAQRAFSGNFNAEKGDILLQYYEYGERGGKIANDDGTSSEMRDTINLNQAAIGPRFNSLVKEMRWRAEVAGIDDSAEWLGDGAHTFAEAREHREAWLSGGGMGEALTERTVNFAEAKDKLDLEVFKWEKAAPDFERRSAEVHELKNEMITVRGKIGEKKRDLETMSWLESKLVEGGAYREDGEVSVADLERCIKERFFQLQAIVSHGVAERNRYTKGSEEYKKAQRERVSPSYRKLESLRRVAKDRLGIELPGDEE